MSQARLRAQMKAVARSWRPWEKVPITPEIAKSGTHMEHVQSIWANHRFEVHCFLCASPVGGFTHIVVARHGLIDYVTNQEMLKIKNELFGVEASSVEVFPAGITELSEKTRHLWVLPAGYELPFGFGMATCWGGE